ncbi:MAG: hypothetical protein BRD57_02275, partial [Proteobacteria bacterium SW_6_67_9]
QRVFDAVAERAAALGVSPWLEHLSATGVLKRLSGGDPAYAGALLTASLDVIDELPAQGLTRSTLAARVLGDAHGLDRGAPVAALVRQVLRHYWRGGIADPTTDARTLWAHAGVRLGGDINSTVLAYQLPVAAHDANGGAIAAANTAAEPVYLTLRQLLRHRLRPPRRDAGAPPDGGLGLTRAAPGRGGHPLRPRRSRLDRRTHSERAPSPPRGHPLAHGCHHAAPLRALLGQCAQRARRRGRLGPRARERTPPTRSGAGGGAAPR